MKKSKGIGDYLKSVQKAVEKGPSPDSIWISKGYARKLCGDLNPIDPDILAFLNDESIPDSELIEFHKGDL